MRYISPEGHLKNRLGDNPFPKWDAAVLCFRSLKGSRDLVELLGAKPVGAKILFGMDESSDLPFVFEATVGGRTVGIATRCLWGGPQAAILVEEIACFGCKYVIGYSCAGAIDLSLERGQQIVADRAVPTDGTSLAYGQAELLADSELLELATNAAQKLGCGITPVCAATVDALYRETPEMVARWRAAGAQVINMETSPFYAASHACGVRSVLIGHVSDRLGQSWESWYGGRKPMSVQTAEICVETLRSLLAE